MTTKLLPLALTLSIASGTPVLAQSKLVLQNLPDGNYLFNQAPTKYVVFRKTGRTLTGESFSYQSDNGYCFQGRANGNAITNMTIEDIEEGVGTKFVFGRSISLKGYRELKSNQMPSGTEQSFQRCLGLRYPQR